MTTLALVPTPAGLPANAAITLTSPGTRRMSRWWTDSAGTTLAANPTTTDGSGNLPSLYALPGLHSLWKPDDTLATVEVGPPSDFVAAGLLADIGKIPSPAQIVAAIPTGTFANVPNPGTPATALVADSGAAAALLAGGTAIPGRSGDTAAFNHRTRLPFNAGLTQLRRDGTTTVNLINMGSLPGADAGTRNLCYFGDPGIEYVSVITAKGLDMANRSIIDMQYIGNLETGLSPRLAQALDSTVPGYDTKTIGIASMSQGGIAGGIIGPGLIDRLVCTSGLSVDASRTTVKNSRLVVEFDPSINTSLAFQLRDTFNGIDALSVDPFGNLVCRTFTGGAVSIANVPIVSSPLGAAFRAAVFRGFASQTANVVEFQASDGTVGFAVDKALRPKSTVQTAPVLSDLADGDTVWYRTSGGNVVFVSRVSGALKTATISVA